MVDPELRALAASDPREFFHRDPPPFILDQIQRVPDLLSSIEVLVEKNPTATGEFILAGSHQPRLKDCSSQSLARRTAILKLFSFLDVGTFLWAGITQMLTTLG